MKENADNQITFNADDLPMERAAKIWQAIGMANDRFGAIPQIAGYLSMYRDWDIEFERRKKAG